MATERGFKTINSIPLAPSTLENIDAGFLEHIDEKLNIHTKTNEGYIKVPVLWLSSERTHQIKNNRNIRDDSGKLKLPLMTIERSSVEKDPSFKGAFQADFRDTYRQAPGHKSKNVYVVARRLLQEKTSKYARNLVTKALKGPQIDENGQEYYPVLNKRLVYEEIISPIPSYISIMYTVVLRAEYQQQMNDLLAPFIASPGNLNYFVFSKNNYNYEAFIQSSFNQNNNNADLGEEERKFETKIEIKVLGYINGDQNSDLGPKIVTRESYVDIKMSREYAVFGSIPDSTNQEDAENATNVPDTLDEPATFTLDGFGSTLMTTWDEKKRDEGTIQSEDPYAPNYVDPSDSFTYIPDSDGDD